MLGVILSHVQMEVAQQHHLYLSASKYGANFHGLSLDLSVLVHLSSLLCRFLASSMR
jgi:hypothetical protein